MLYHQPNAKRRWYAVNGKKQIQQAYASILDNDFEQAIRSFEQAIKLEPDNPEYHFRLSITYARSGKLSSALKHAQRACELEPAHETYRYQLLHLQAMELVREAEKLAEAGGRRRLRQATRLLREAILKDPLSLEAYPLAERGACGARKLPAGGGSSPGGAQAESAARGRAAAYQTISRTIRTLYDHRVKETTFHDIGHQSSC